MFYISIVIFRFINLEFDFRTAEQCLNFVRLLKLANDDTGVDPMHKDDSGVLLCHCYEIKKRELKMDNETLLTCNY